MQLLALAVAICVALAYAEPEAWGGDGEYDGGYRRVGVLRGGFGGKFGSEYYGRKKRSGDPEPIAKPEAEPEAQPAAEPAAEAAAEPAAEPAPCCFGGSRRGTFSRGSGAIRGG